MKRQHIAELLLGLCVAPLCVLFGLMEAALFQWTGTKLWLCVAFCVLLPLIGSFKTKQRTLTIGLLAGLIIALLTYRALVPHS